MSRLYGCIMLAAVVLTAIEVDNVRGQAPTYQRHRDQATPSRAEPTGRQYGGAMDSPYAGRRGSNYQRHGYADSPPRYREPQMSGGYFQRPYPYHLDYYRMRWGGSYAPYFGNLYGPPNVILGVPNYYYGNGGYYSPMPVMPYGATPEPMP
ncbi:hypothetical protein [Aeoliella mucimassa]|nr:hypothetical protein [Aeoliella mucimassa]